MFRAKRDPAHASRDITFAAERRTAAMRLVQAEASTVHLFRSAVYFSNQQASICRKQDPAEFLHICCTRPL